jgi:tRNA(Ile)-lysidine synthase
MKTSLLQQLGEYWKEKKYVLPGQFVLLAVSGGGDSMVMAHLFLKSNIRFAIAHCNFGLRGKESDLDEQLVKDWCIMNEVKYHGVS